MILKLHKIYGLSETVDDGKTIFA